MSVLLARTTIRTHWPQTCTWEHDPERPGRCPIIGEHLEAAVRVERDCDCAPCPHGPCECRCAVCVVREVVR